ncbi:hypothetical protein C2S51_008726 [Perilla frutescens var. frutescens]|nr:hypothetical protein C2S51_008726 [Perilla frutescens var. frutescens]
MSEKGSELGSEYTNDTGSVVRSDMGVEGESIGADRSGLETESDSEVFARSATRDAAKKRKSKGDGEKKAMVSPRPPAQVAEIRAFVNQKVVIDLEERFDGFKIRIPTPAERACSPPDDWMALYTAIFDIGVGLPLHPYFLSIIGRYGLAPGQIAPNGWSQMAGMYLLWQRLGFGEPSFEDWHAAYYISTKKADPYIFHFSFRPNWKQKGSKGSNRKFLEGLTSSNSEWKSSFIFVPNVVAGQSYATTAFVETHCVFMISSLYSAPPVASSKEISGRILAALKVVDLSFDTIIDRKKRSISGDPGQNRVTVINTAALRVKTTMVKPFVEPDGADDAPFGFIRSYQSPGDSASGPKEKEQNLASSAPVVPVSLGVPKRPLFQPFGSSIGVGMGGSLVGSSKPAWLVPMETKLENLAVSPDWLGSLPVGVSETLALAQQQALLAELTVNECKRRIDEELLRLIDRSTRSSEEAACWKEKFDRLNGEHVKLLDREATLQKELDASKHSETALRVKVDSQDEQLEKLREKVAELRAGIGLDRAVVFNSESWSGLRKQMEEHYISGVIDDVMTHCDGDINKYRGWLEDRAKEVSAEDGTAEPSTTAEAARAPSST